MRVKLIMVFFCVGLSSCFTIKIYQDNSSPVFYSNEKHKYNSKEVDSFNVLTFNIKESKKINLAIHELKELIKVKPVDLYLFQELDEKAVKQISEELGLNYLYFPIVYNRLIKKNIGNAILSKSKITQPEKLILPNKKAINNRRRHAVVGEIEIHQKKILVYSVHTETSAMSTGKRMQQVNAILEHAQKQSTKYNYFIIGGDFNTLFSKDVNEVVSLFRSNGYAWEGMKIGSTAKAFFGLVKPKHDYIFSKGLQYKNTFKIDSSKSSDHFPVFATFQF